MILALHIFIALASVVATTYAWFVPSAGKLTLSYALVVGTLVSGTYLVVSTHAPMLGACTTGLLYVGVVSMGLVAVHRKLARQRTQ